MPGWTVVRRKEAGWVHHSGLSGEIKGRAPRTVWPTSSIYIKPWSLRPSRSCLCHSLGICGISDTHLPHSVALCILLLCEAMIFHLDACLKMDFAFANQKGIDPLKSFEKSFSFAPISVRSMPLSLPAGRIYLTAEWEKRKKKRERKKLFLTPGPAIRLVVYLFFFWGYNNKIGRLSPMNYRPAWFF